MNGANGRVVRPDLPRGWEWKTVGEIADCRLGKMLDKNKNVGEPRPYLRNINVQWGRFDLEDIKEMRISDAEVERYEVRTGDLLVCEGGEPGRCAVWREDRTIFFQKALHRVRPGPGLLADFLQLCLLDAAASGRLSALFTGTTIKHLPGVKLAQLAVPVPPLEEQHRIVELVEEAMAALDTADDALVRARAKAYQLREVLAERVASMVGPRPRLAELLKEPLRNGHSATASGDDSGIRTLTLTAVTDSAFVDQNTKLTTADPDRVKHLWLEPGDILVQRSNTPQLVGSAALYSGPRDWAIFPDLLIRVRTQQVILPEFLIQVLQAPSVRRHLRSKAQGIAGSMPKISQGTLEELRVPVPPLAVQKAAVAEMKQRDSAITTAVRGIDQAAKASSALRLLILRRGVAGTFLLRAGA